MPTTLDDTRPTARKTHVCDDCGRTIVKGETYRRWSGIGDDGPYTWKSCGHCSALAVLILAADKYAYDYDYGLDIELWMGDYAADHEMADLRDQYNARWRNEDGTGLVPVPGIAPDVEQRSGAVAESPSGVDRSDL